MAMNFEQANEVVRSVRRLANAHRGRVAELLRNHGLQPGQEVVLLELASLGRASQAELALAAEVDEPSVCRSLARLEKQGLVARTADAADGRRRLVELTAQGRELTPKLKRVYMRLAQEAVGEPDGHFHKRSLKTVRDLSRRFE